MTTIPLRLAALVSLVLAWQLLASLVDEPVFWPPFADVAGRLWSSWLTDPAVLAEHLLPSVARLLAGWLLAVAVGIGLGTLIGLSGRARDYLEPSVHFLRALPAPALLPLFIVLLGIGDAMKVAMIGFGVVWPILLNTIDGVASVDPLHRETGRVFRVSPRDALTGIVLPSAGPQIFAGLRISLSIAVILMVISEMVATLNGVGFQLLQAQRSFRTLDVWAGIVLLGLIGYGLNACLGVVERRALPWRHAESSTA